MTIIELRKLLKETGHEKHLRKCSNVIHKFFNKTKGIQSKYLLGLIWKDFQSKIQNSFYDYPTMVETHLLNVLATAYKIKINRL